MGGKRKLQLARCSGCGLHNELCLCPSMPQIDLNTRIMIIQHGKERHKPTNTAKLILRMFPNSSMVHYAIPGQALIEPPLEEPITHGGVLFPRPDSLLLSNASFLSSANPSRTLFVFDGTWSQCSRMSRRIPLIESLPCFHLPAGRPSYWTIRNTPDPTRLCTFEAIARALDILEGSERIKPAFDCFAQVSARMLFMKGKLPKPIAPEEWLRPWTQLDENKNEDENKVVR